jgi:Xaa-Pro dipeptidase
MNKATAFPIDEYKTRIEKIKKVMEHRRIDLMLITSPENIYYVSGFDSIGYYQHQVLFLSLAGGQPVLLVQAVEETLAHATSWLDSFELWAHGMDPIEITIDKIKELVGDSPNIGVEKAGWWLKIGTYEKIKENLPKATFSDVSDLIPELRIYKSELEVEYVRRAAELSDIGLQKAIEAVQEGVTENDVAAEVYHALFKNGSEYSPIPFLINSGSKSASLHGTSTDKVIEKGDVVTLELGGVCNRYTVNPLRTVVVGKPSEKIKEIHGLLHDALTEATAAVKPGVPVGELDRITRRITKKYDFGRLHRTGYGLEAGYPPAWMGNLSILNGDPHILEPRMVFSIEPTIVVRDEGFGVVLGNNILVTENGHEVLNKLPLDLVAK